MAEPREKLSDEEALQCVDFLVNSINKMTRDPTDKLTMLIMVLSYFMCESVIAKEDLRTLRARVIRQLREAIDKQWLTKIMKGFLQ